MVISLISGRSYKLTVALEEFSIQVMHCLWRRLHGKRCGLDFLVIFLCVSLHNYEVWRVLCVAECGV